MADHDDVLARLEERLERASDAAERLFADAAEAAFRRPPPQGFEADQEPRSSGGEFDQLLAALDAVAELVPPDLRRRLREAVREVLLAVRALIDWYLERSERQATEPPEVQDIPVV